MTENNPETQPELVDKEDGPDPERDADGVAKSALSRWGVYQTTVPGRGGYVATYDTKREAAADPRVKDQPDRYSIRHV